MRLEFDVFGLSPWFCAVFQHDFPKTDRLDGANVAAKEAADAFIVVAVRTAGRFVPFHGLVGAIIARDVASSAADAFIFVDLGIDDVVAVEFLGGDDVGVGLSDEFF